MIFRRAHIIKHWAVTQKHVTLSCGEGCRGGTRSAVLGLGHRPASEVGGTCTAAEPLGSPGAQASDVCGTWLLVSSGCKSVSARLLSPCTRFPVIAILQICAPSTLGVQLLTIFSALLGYTLRPVEQGARHLCPPQLSCFQQVGKPSADVTRLTPNDEEECETVELNLCRLCCMRVEPGGRCPTPRGYDTHAADRELTGTFERRADEL